VWPEIAFFENVHRQAGVSGPGNRGFMRFHAVIETDEVGNAFVEHESGKPLAGLFRLGRTSDGSEVQAPDNFISGIKIDLAYAKAGGLQSSGQLVKKRTEGAPQEKEMPLRIANGSPAPGQADLVLGARVLQ